MNKTNKMLKADRIIQKKLRGDIPRNVLFSDELTLGWIENIDITDQNIKQYYQETYAQKYYEEEKAKIETNFENFLPLQKRRVEYIKEFLAPADSLLEIGCGPGYFLKAVSPYCKNAKGLELNANEVKFAREKAGLNVEAGSIDSLQGQTFNHICLFQVLEHQPDPVGFLLQLQQIANETKCYVHVELPTLHNPLVSLYQVQAFRDFWFQEPHLFYFTMDSMVKIADQAGLKVVKKFLDQESSLINHINWMLNGKPMKHRKYVVDPAPPTEFSNDLIRYDMEKTSKKVNEFFLEMNIRYRELMKELDFGDVLFCTLEPK